MNTQFWWNQYVGIPFAHGGASRLGCDCWGLVRLVYSEQFGIDLPGPTVAAGRADMDGALTLTREALWEPADDHRPGDVAVFTVAGHESHVGLITTPGYMLHAIKGGGVGIEPYRGSRWGHRLTGVHRYKGARDISVQRPDNGVRVIGCPHPLTTARIDAVVPVGPSLADIIHEQCNRLGVPDDIRVRGHAYVDAQYVPFDAWSDTHPADGQVVTFRVLPAGGGGGLRTALMLTVAVAAIALSAYVGGLPVFANGGTLLGMGGAFWGGVAALGVTVAGTLALNTLFPAPAPKLPSADNWRAEPTYFLSGSQNKLRPYGAIPQVLGVGRATLDYLGKPYSERSGDAVNHLRAAYCAGYGPLEISDVRNGDTPINRYSEMEYMVCQGLPTDPAPKYFTKDVDEVAINTELKKSDGWHTFTTPDDTDQINIEMYWPNGLWAKSADSGRYIDIVSAFTIQFRAVGSANWNDIHTAVAWQSFTLPTCSPFMDAQIVYDANGNLEASLWWLQQYGVPKKQVAATVDIDLWQWHVFSVNQNNRLVHRIGMPTDSPYSEPSARLLKLMAQSKRQWDNTVFTSRLPAMGDNEEMLYRVCVKGDRIVAIEDGRDDPARIMVGYSQTGPLVINFGGSIDRGGEDTYSRRGGNSQRKPMTRSFTYDVTRGKYDWRIRKTSSDYKDTRHIVQHSLVLRVARYWRRGRPFTPPKPLARVEMRVRATNQLNGAMDAINALVKSVVLDYDRASGAWVQRVSNNPASLFRHVLQGPAIATADRVPDSGIDIAQLERWHNFCRAQGCTYFNVKGDNGTSVFEVLQEIAAAGHATVDYRDGKWTVVMDEPRTRVIGHVGPHNSWGFTGYRTTVDMPHAIKAQFINQEKGYEQDMLIVYADGYGPANASKFEEWGLDKLAGITNPRQVFIKVRRGMATAKLCSEKYRFSMDIEHIIFHRGDLIRYTSDVAMWGLGTGRVKSRVMSAGACVGVVIDTPVQMQPGTRYTMRFRLSAAKGATRKVTLSSVSTEGLYTEVRFAGITSDMPDEGDLYQFGSLNAESRELLIESIRPGADQTAEIQCIDYVPEIFTLTDEPIPDLESGITMPPDLPDSVIADTPKCDGAYSDERALVVGADGTLTCRIGVIFAHPKTLDRRITHAQVRFATGGAEWQVSSPAPVTDGAVFCEGVKEGKAYDVQGRYLTADGVAGEWVAMVRGHVVAGKTAAPPDVPRLGVENKALVWAYDDPPLDLKGFRIRCAYGDVADWDAAAPVRDGFTTDCRFDISRYIDNRKRTWMVKAEDTGGRLSEAPAIFVTAAYELQADDPAPRNLIYTHDLAALGWPGYKSGCAVVGSAPGVLAARETSLFWDDAGGKFWQPADALFWSSRYSRMTYSFTWRPDSTLVGLDLREGIVTTAEIESIEYSTGSEALFWPEDDALPFWTDDGQAFWGPFKWYPLPTILQRVQDRYYSFRVSLRDSDNIAQIQQCKLIIDVPDKREEVTTSVSAAGTRLPIAKGYRAVKYVYLSLVDDGGNAVTCRYMDKSTAGPMVRCYDLAGNPCAGTVDAIVVGY